MCPCARSFIMKVKKNANKPTGVPHRNDTTSTYHEANVRCLGGNIQLSAPMLSKFPVGSHFSPSCMLSRDKQTVCLFLKLTKVHN